MTIIDKELPAVIGVDHGYGNIKTANVCFPTGVTAWDAEPLFKNDLLVYGGRCYTIGSGHKEYTADKIGDDDFYLLTLAAVARELNIRGMTEVRVHLAAGLPLTWVASRGSSFDLTCSKTRAWIIPSAASTTMSSLRALMFSRRASPPWPASSAPSAARICSAISATAR